MADELLVTSGAKMRAAREEGVVLPFPSGNYYRCKSATAAGLLRRGNLPNPLLTFTVDAFYNGTTQEKYDAFVAVSNKAESILALMDSLRVICEEMFVSPRIVAKPQDENEVSIDDVPLEDQFWAFRLTFKPVEVLYPFRPEPAADVVNVPEPQDLSQVSE